MKIFYRSMQTAFLVIAASLTTVPVHAQLTREQREQERERERETRAARLAPPHVQVPVTQETLTLPAPRIVNFQELADYQLAHPKTDSTKRNIEQGEEADNYKFKPWPVRPDAKVSPIPRAVSNGAGHDAKAATSPAPIISFNGVMGDGSVVPPDIKGCSGLNHVIETTNQSFGIYNKTTGALISSVDITTFFNSSGGNGYFDPHCMYDAVHDKYLIVIDGNTSGGNGGLFLAVSQTGNPTGSWYVYTIDDGVNQNTLLDFPLMGYNKNWVVLTANLFQGSSPITEIYVMNRASLYSGTQGTITHFTDANSFCLSPAQTVDTTQLTEYMVQNSNGNSGGNGYVQIGTITGAIGSPTYTAGSQLGVAQPWNDNTVMAVQKGNSGLLDNDDDRIYATQYINGSMWFAHTIWLPASGTPTYSGVDWWQVNPVTNVVQQFGRIADATTPTFYYYPNIYANSAGDALLGYSVSSSSVYASAAYRFHASTDAVNTMEGEYVYKAGVAGYAPTGFGSDLRWGDYSGCAVDPADNSFWVFGEWANTNNLWSTQIAHVAASAPISIPPVANFQANVTTSCTGVIQFSDLSTNSPTSWLWTFGDGGTSNVQNPTHTYLTNGTYTVILKATNTFGNNTKTLTGYITINEPTGPAAVGASHCGSGTFSLAATTTNPVKWFNSTGTLVSTSNPFVTPVLSQTTTYYVQDSVIAPADSAGPKNNAILGTGGYLNTTFGLNFDVLQAGTLQSVYLYAQAAGSITITVANSGGTTINTATVNVPAGGSRVTLNFPLTVGTGYLITWTGAGMTLYRNNAGAVYPYTDANGIVSITGNNAGTVPTYYYWFYDWYVTGPGCNSQSTAVTATVTAGVTSNASLVSNVSCFGGTNGSASVAASGGTPSYTYSWSNGQTTTNLTGVIAGTYSVTVHDAAGCSGTSTQTISQPNAINVSVTAVNASCGASTGSASAAVTGGTSGYTYLWSNSSTASAISNIAPATYTLTVTDAHQCSSTSAATIGNSGQLNITATPNATNCTGNLTGGATANIAGGTSPFTYSWSNGATAVSISGVSAGTYRVTATDHLGCSGTASVVITIGAAVNLTTSSNNVTCFNSNTGSGSVTAVSGTSPYNYAWSNGSSSAALTNLVAGHYVVTVTDAHSCQAVDSIVVTQPGAITVFVNAIQPTCAGSNNGSATVSATGGTPGYNYTWSTTATGSGINNLTPGSYGVTLTDVHSCTSLATFSITNPVPVSANVTAANDSCYGVSDGTVQLTSAGGTRPYSYLWSNNGTSATLTGLAAGTYTVTITDNHNCSGTATTTISQPAQIAVTTTSTDATNGQANGTATVSNVTGGNAPYVATWSNGLTGNTINNVVAGNYTVTVTDRNGCETTASVVVNNSVGIATVNSDLSFSIYPNPAKTEVTIDAGNLEKETTLVLEDILGQSLIVKNINTSTTAIDLSTFSNGVYFIELRQGGKRSVKKFVISR